MAVWKQANLVFHGGTTEAMKLKGRRVRNRVSLLSAPLYDPINATQDTVDLQEGAIGLLANAVRDQLLIAYPKDANAPVTTVENLARSDSFNVVSVNWPTFRIQFDIES